MHACAGSVAAVALHAMHPAEGEMRTASLACAVLRSRRSPRSSACEPCLVVEGRACHPHEAPFDATISCSRNFFFAHPPCTPASARRWSHGMTDFQRA